MQARSDQHKATKIIFSRLPQNGRLSKLGGGTCGRTLAKEFCAVHKLLGRVGGGWCKGAGRIHVGWGRVWRSGNQRQQAEHFCVSPVALADIGATSEAAVAGEQGAPGLGQGVEE